MQRIVKAVVVISALGVLGHARPASACDAHQKTTMAKTDKAQPEKAAKAKQSAKEAKTPQKDESAQAKNVASARSER
jgi:hypothetical protein